MSDQTTPGPVAQQPRHIPANLPPAVLLNWLKFHRLTTYMAVPLPPCFRLKLHGVARALQMDGWAIMSTNGEVREVEMMGLNEVDAKARAAALNTREQATGRHSWS